MSPVPATFDRLKRWLDVLLALSLLVLLSPLLLLLALGVVLVDGPPIFFRQERIGRGGQPFWILKFRTMRAGCGPDVTVRGDPRVTPMGSLLRRSKLDELPQLLNVLTGDMSLVGPRPEVPKYVAMHPRLFRAIGDLRPGLTDLASLIYRDEEQLLRQHEDVAGFYESALLPKKLALARLYRGRRSFALDCCLLIATACAVLGLHKLSDFIVGRRLASRARYFQS